MAVDGSQNQVHAMLTLGRLTRGGEDLHLKNGILSQVKPKS